MKKLLTIFLIIQIFSSCAKEKIEPVPKQIKEQIEYYDIMEWGIKGDSSKTIELQIPSGSIK